MLCVDVVSSDGWKLVNLARVPSLFAHAVVSVSTEGALSSGAAAFTTERVSHKVVRLKLLTHGSFCQLKRAKNTTKKPERSALLNEKITRRVYFKCARESTWIESCISCSLSYLYVNVSPGVCEQQQPQYGDKPPPCQKKGQAYVCFTCVHGASRSTGAVTTSLGGAFKMSYFHPLTVINLDGSPRSNV